MTDDEIRELLQGLPGGERVAAAERTRLAAR
jgi:hypothetical protein